MPVIDKSAVPRSDLPIPHGFYGVKPLKAEACVSKGSGADQVKLTLQIISPENHTTEDKQIVRLAGRTFWVYITYTESIMERAIRQTEAILGNELAGSFDTKDAALAVVEALRGKWWPSAELKAKQRFKTDPSTYELIYENGQTVPDGWDIVVGGKDQILPTPVLYNGAF